MYNHILLAAAPNHFGEYAKALSIARKLLEPEGKISILAVLEEIPSYVDQYLPPDLMKKNLSEVSDSLISKFRNSGVETHVIAGRAASSIVDWSKANDVDCVVISSHRPGVSDYLLGSTASRVVRHSKCAVHVLR